MRHSLSCPPRIPKQSLQRVHIERPTSHLRSLPLPDTWVKMPRESKPCDQISPADAPNIMKSYISSFLTTLCDPQIPPANKSGCFTCSNVEAAGTGEMAQMLGEFPNLAENPRSLSSIHNGWLTTACNSRFKTFSTLLRLLPVATHMCMY